MERNRKLLIFLLVILYNLELVTSTDQEFITITQHTPRIRRDASAVQMGDYFPSMIHFTLHLKNNNKPLHLYKHLSPQEIDMFSGDDLIQPDFNHPQFQFAAYQDVQAKASVIVDCQKSPHECTLQGSFYNSGIKYKIEPVNDEKGTHNVTKTVEDHDAVDVGRFRRNEVTNVDAILSEYKKDLEQVAEKRRLSPDSSSDLPVDRSPNTINNPSNPEKRGERLAGKKRSTIGSTCNILEVQAVADYTVWEFFLEKTGTVYGAIAEIHRHYAAIFSEVDLRYKCLEDQTYSICFRVFLSVIKIERTQAESWSNVFTNTGTGNVDAVNSLIRCGQNKLPHIDTNICFTRLEIEHPGESLLFRSFSFFGVLCETLFEDFQAINVEDLHDDINLLVTNAILTAMFVESDLVLGCNDSLSYIGALFNFPPSIPGTEHFPWLFSNCSLDGLNDYLNFLDNDPDIDNCLKEGSISEAELDEIASNQPLPGLDFEFDLDYQCQLAFGLSSFACIGPGQHSIFDFDSICWLGVYCYVNGACDQRSRVYNGSPCGCKKRCFKNKCEREFSVPLGGVCKGICECVEDNSVCDCANETCVCAEGFYDSNKLEPNGTCLPEVATGGPCPSLDAVCVDPNAVCDNITVSCQCIDGFFAAANGTCLIEKQLCDACSSSDECASVNAMCMMHECTCSPSQFVNECGTCEMKLGLGENCTGEDMCLDSKSCCNPVTGRCECVPGTYDEDGVCTDEILTGGPCPSVDAVCADPNAVCDNVTVSCSCIDGYFAFTNGTCLIEKQLCDSCSLSEECASVNATCMMNECKCSSDQFVDECGTCTMKLENGSPCSGEEMCLDPKSCCNSLTMRCECVSGTFDTNGDAPGGVCNDSIPNGQECDSSLDDQCADPNAECINDTCECIDGFFEFNNGTCLINKQLCDRCQLSEECASVNATCMMNECKCSADQFVDECGACKMKLENGEHCSGEDMCLDPKSCCNPVTMRCECVRGTFDTNGNATGGVCNDTIVTGQGCDSSLGGQCADPNADCNNDTCECIDGYFEFDNGTCLINKQLCDHCQLSDECASVNATCIMNECKCSADQFVDECGTCKMKLENGEQCSGEDTCLDPKACCNPVNMRCECVQGTFDTNGNAPGGECNETISTGQGCDPNIEGQCADPNAVCNNDTVATCECIDGYFELDNGTCLINKQLCDKCQLHEECESVNATCMMNECKCLPDQYVDECGTCKMKLENGENCAGEEMCLDPKSCCNPVTMTCECVPGSYDTNGIIMGGVCNDSISTGQECDPSLEGQCADPNAECKNDTMATCECVDGYFEFENGTCLLNKQLCDHCQLTDECASVNATCMMNECKCSADQFVDECGTCKMKLENGEQCSGEDMCLDPKSCCNPVTMRCECVPGTFDTNGNTEGGVCNDTIPTGQGCDSRFEGQCSDPHAECINDTCECIGGYFEFDNGTCLINKQLCDHCQLTAECASVNATCMVNECKCSADQFVDECGTCKMKLENGEQCSGEDMCIDPKSCCNPVTMTCECVPGTYDTNGNATGGVCNDSIPTGEGCDQSLDDQCADPNAECISYTCECIDGYFEFNNGTCLINKRLCDHCQLSDECASVNATCMMNECKCSADQYVDECGTCKMKLENGELCSGEDMCLDQKSCCNPVTMRCECVRGTFDTNGNAIGGVCNDTIPTGQGCDPSQEGQCADPNAECNTDIVSTCKCIDGYFELDNGTCLINKRLCDNCQSSEECASVNATCMMNECKCSADQYVDVCGTCKIKIPLGGNCSGNAVCADEFAVCDPSTLTCICVQYRYDSNLAEPEGQCLPLIPNGNNCMLNGSCEDSNADCFDDVCSCVEEYFLADNGTCLQIRYVSEPCTMDMECSFVQAVCNANGRCKCNESFYLDQHGMCQPKIPLGENCGGNAVCADELAVCDPSTLLCTCAQYAYDSNLEDPAGQCLPLILNGKNCTLNGSCGDCNAECANGICTCNEGFFLQNGTCIPFKLINEHCTTDIECSIVQAVCDMTGVCKCNDTFYVDSCGICQPRIPLGENCSGDTQCLDSQAFCDPKTKICVCSSSTYDNDGQSESNGTCVDKIPNGGPCNESIPDSCADPNAVCTGDPATCECDEGFVESAGGVCEATNLCDSCSTTADCSAVNGTCIGGQCKCTEDQFVNECGICEIKRQLGENCSGEIMCLDGRSFCNPVSMKCECVQGTYDNNSDNLGGMCADLIPNGNNCTLNGSCEDCNAACLNSVCTCKPGFFEADNGTCIPFRFVNEPCTIDMECSAVQAICDSSGVCKCNDSSYVDSCGICRPRIPLGENCSGDTQCLDPQAYCDPDINICVCSNSTYDLDGTCVDKISNGGSCNDTIPNSCTDPNAICTGDPPTCQCEDGFVESAGGVCECEIEINLCDPCSSTADCSDVNGSCMGGQCKCTADQFVNDCGICEMKKELGENCSGEIMCLDDRSFCNPVSMECECTQGTYDNNSVSLGGVCADLIPNGNSCAFNGSCEDCNAACLNGVCTCIPGFFEADNGTCIPFRFVNEPCTIDMECSAVQAICDSNGICKCNDTFYLDPCGICRARIPLGENCSGDAQCLDPQAYCDPRTSVCVCSNGTYDLDGTCVEKISNGGSCNDSIPNSCTDPNAICIGDPPTCQCEDGFVESAGGVCECEIEINLCDQCSSTADCFDVNGTCMGGQCKCTAGQFVNDCGICEMKRELGENCSGEVMCLDDRSFCNPVSMECECVQGTYDNNSVSIGGVCADLIPNGNNCPFNGSCEDCNAACLNGVCTCIPGFFEADNGTCIPFRFVNEPCTIDMECSAVQAVCDSSGICKCNDTFYLDPCGICRARIPLGENCSGDAQCLDPQAYCDPGTSVCVCSNGTYDLDGTCVEKISNGGSCNDSIPNSCTDPNAICTGDPPTCQCEDGFFESAGGVCECEIEINLCDPCSSTADCSDVNGSCMGGQCKCTTDQFVNDCGICEMKRELGENCTGEVMCLDDRSFCNPVSMECECVQGTYDNNSDTLGGVCADLIPNGSNCSFNGSCEDCNAACLNGVCTCKPGFFEADNGTCIPFRFVNEPCTTDMECSVVQAVCDSGGICKCNGSFYLDPCGICRPRIPLGENCSGDAQCLDPQAYCDPGTNVCVCSNGTYDLDGTCVETIPNGGSCNTSTPNSCADSNAVCTGDPATCQCAVGFVETTDGVCECEIEINLCDPCSTSADCSNVNGTCMGGQCKCSADQFVNECGLCELKRQLGENCSGEIMCLDDRSFCNPISLECECVQGTYDNNGYTLGGVCTDLIPNGSNCTFIGSCEDCAAECLNDVCTCIDEFFEAENGTCIPFRFVNEPCTIDMECSAVQAICDSSGTCKCNDSFYLDPCGICRPRIALGENCSRDTQCLDPQAYCYPDSNTCVCSNSTYDSDGPNGSVGICVDKIPNGGSCNDSIPNSCADPNAICTGDTPTCDCDEGFVESVGGVCECGAETNLCDSCSTTDDCTSVNGTCMGGQCKCTTDEFVNECGVCEMKRQLGENCSGEVMCLDDRGFCNPVSMECECVQGTYDNNSDTLAGVCEDLIQNGINCTLNGSCEDCNALCLDGVCTCKDGFFEADNGTCILFRFVNEPCTIDMECSVIQAICDSSGVCKCNDTFYIDPHGICRQRIPLGENCSRDTQCLDPQAFCDPVTSTCVCSNNTYDSDGSSGTEGTCVDKITNGGSCNDSIPNSCADPNAICIGDTPTCECDEGFVESTGGVCECETEINLCDSCSTTADCAAVNGTCMGGQCKCTAEQFVNECGVCEIKRLLGENCSGEVMCLGDRSFCNPVSMECECVQGTFDNNSDTLGGVCTDLIPNGNNCTLNGSCEDPNALCLNDVCACKDGFFEAENGTCIPFLFVNEPCTIDMECSAVQAFCDSSGVCKCNDSFYVDSCGICRPRIPLGGNCSGDTQCIDPQAYCDPLTNTCVCSPDTYDYDGPSGSDGSCVDRIPTGQACNASLGLNPCADPNAECNIDTGSTCECIDGYFEFTNGTCLIEKQLCDHCQLDEECMSVNATCMMNECKCSDDQFVDECGTCKTKLENGEACSGEDMCIDPKSCCNPLTMTCECVNGTYDNNGDAPGGMCNDTIPNGGSCNASIPNSCTDPNAICTGDPPTCQCVDGFIESSGGVCECGANSETNLCDSCSTTADCSTVNGTCMEGQCKCTADQYVNECGICEMRVALEANCSGDAECLDPNAYCDPITGVCVCIPGFFDSNGTCTAQADLGEACASTAECLDCNANCINGTCTCLSPFVEISGVCVSNGSAAFTDFCDACSTTSDCDRANAVCSNNTCLCPTGFFIDECGDCQQSTIPGDQCTSDSECCCDTDDDNECESSSAAGNCIAVCDGGVCVEIFTGGGDDDNDNDDDNDVEDLLSGSGQIGDSCNNDGDCVEPNTVCTNSLCQCSSDTVLDDELNICRVPNGFPCIEISGENNCQDSNAVCVNDSSSCSVICGCSPSYYNSAEENMCGGTCILRPTLGQNCTISVDPCEDVCFESTCRASVCTGDVELYDICVNNFSCEEYPNTVCSSYQTLGFTPPSGRTNSDKICVCDMSDGFFQIDLFCFCNPFANLTNPVCEQ